MEEKNLTCTKEFINKLKDNKDTVEIIFIPKKWSFVQEINLTTTWKEKDVTIFTHDTVKRGEFIWTEGLKELLELLENNSIENLSSNEVYNLDHSYDEGGEGDPVDIKWYNGWDDKKKGVSYTDFSDEEKEELEDEVGLYDLYQEKYFEGELEDEGLKFEKGSIYQIIVNTGSEKFILTNNSNEIEEE